MNLPGFIISFVVFIYTLRIAYEVWFNPQRFSKRADGYRNTFKEFLGFSYWTNGYVNWTLVKVASIFILLVSLLGIVVSITGPIVY